MAPNEELDMDLRKENKYGSRTQATWAMLIEFFSISNIHGVRHFSERNRHWSERVVWIIAIGLSLCLCGILIWNVLIKWNQTPVIVSFAEKSAPVWEVPFPAVTVCPETKSYANKLNFTDAYNMLIEGMKVNMSDETMMRMRAVGQLCDAHLFYNLEMSQKFTDDIIYNTIKDVAPLLNDTMFMCKWKNQISSGCSELFQPILTDEGICYTFNMLNSRDIYTDEVAPELITVTGNKNATNWNMEDGFDDREENAFETYPFRVFGTGPRAGLYALLNLFEQDLEYLCRGPVQGFKVILHRPDEVPQASKHFFRVPLLQEVLVSIKPQMITTSESLRNYEPNRRQCYFSSERKLQFFKVYTQNNCELECLSNFTRNHCGCTKFSMPRDKNTLICGVDKIQCYNEAEDLLLQKEYIDGLRNKGIANQGCNCLPACTSITYDAEISQAKFDWINLFKAFKYPFYDEFTGIQPARLTIYFKENQFRASKRSELYGTTDLIANCGGLLVLFMGISVLSIFDAVYYFTLRLGCSLRSRR